MSWLGQLVAVRGHFLIPEATSCMQEAHWVKLAWGRLIPWSPSRGCTSGGGGGTAKREIALRALFSLSLRLESMNGDSKRVTYLLIPCICIGARGNSLHVGSRRDPNLMYSNLQ